MDASVSCPAQVLPGDLLTPILQMMAPSLGLGLSEPAPHPFQPISPSCHPWFLGLHPESPFQSRPRRAAPCQVQSERIPPQMLTFDGSIAPQLCFQDTLCPKNSMVQCPQWLAAWFICPCHRDPLQTQRVSHKGPVHQFPGSWLLSPGDTLPSLMQAHPPPNATKTGPGTLLS